MSNFKDESSSLSKNIKRIPIKRNHNSRFACFHNSKGKTNPTHQDLKTPCVRKSVVPDTISVSIELDDNPLEEFLAQAEKSSELITYVRDISDKNFPVINREIPTPISTKPLQYIETPNVTGLLKPEQFQECLSVYENNSYFLFKNYEHKRIDRKRFRAALNSLEHWFIFIVEDPRFVSMADFSAWIDREFGKLTRGHSYYTLATNIKHVNLSIFIYHSLANFFQQICNWMANLQLPSIQIQKHRQQINSYFQKFNASGEHK